MEETGGSRSGISGEKRVSLEGGNGLLTLRQFDFDRDYQAVIRLWRSAGPGIQLSPSDAPQEVRKKLARDPDLFLVAQMDGRLVGAVLGGFDGRRGMVYHLAVSPQARRRGVGKRLMEELESRLRDKGCIKYYLLVTHDNQEALDFYRALGCEVMDLHVLGKRLR
jgi:ribosomal protein S18 acetylase RimI-like enzyme